MLKVGVICTGHEGADHDQATQHGRGYREPAWRNTRRGSLTTERQSGETPGVASGLPGDEGR